MDDCNDGKCPECSSSRLIRRQTELIKKQERRITDLLNIAKSLIKEVDAGFDTWGLGDLVDRTRRAILQVEPRTDNTDTSGKKCPRCFLRPCACDAEREFEKDEREHHDRY